MNLHVIASGSSGNCYCIDNNGHFIFIDAGAPLKTIKNGLSGITPKETSLFITHEHTDHISGLASLISYYSPKIYTSEKTAEYLVNSGKVDSRNLYVLDADVVYDFDSFAVKPFNIMHDAVEPYGYRFEFGDRVYSIATDFGAVTDYLLKAVEGTDTITLESNYEDELLKKNKKYPDYLKRRIMSKNGHLSNKDAFYTVGELSRYGLKKCFLAHVSENSNDYHLLDKYAESCNNTHNVSAVVLRQKTTSVFEI